MKSLANRYQLLSELGKGGMGTVYKAIDSQTNATVAVKHLKTEMTEPELIERFRREGEALRELNHPNIVKLLDTIEQDGAYYLVMEYVAGGDLSALLKTGQVSVERCLKIALDLADALTRAHKLDIIHRDLKPANVLLAEDGTLRLTDFGVARMGQRERLTERDMIVGTVEYLAPEALDGTGIDQRSDIWAFGVMLFEMLTSQCPFRGSTLTATIMAIISQSVPDLEKLRPDAPIALIDLIYRMLVKDHTARIASIRHVGAELEDILQGRDMSLPATRRFATPIPESYHRPKHNIPAQTTAFVGREAELSELAKLLNNPKIRLITIVAQGGMGKTRLALELAEQTFNLSSPLGRGVGGEGFANGVYFVELAPVSEPANIASAIAEATSYSFQSDEREQKQQILDFLGNKNMLLVMDNYEHLLEAASLVTDILKAAPDVKILVTSRQRLNQSGENIFNLEGMDFPVWETPADALEYAAVKLFMQSAKRAQASFELTKENMDAVARICKLVQGMPLGILMAAACLEALSADEIAVEIAESIDFLATRLDDVPERQRSIRAVFDYSWNLLNEAEKQVFMKLAIFRGGFTRKAGQAITGATLQDLMSLVNKSLLRRDNDSGRYEIHELLRQYAAEKAEEAGQSTAIAAAHTAYYAKAMQERDSHLRGHRQLEALNELDADFENVRAAWIWAVEHEVYEAIDQMQKALVIYCSIRTRLQDAIYLFDLAIQGLEKPGEESYKAIYARLLTNLAQTYSLSVQTDLAHQAGLKGLEIIRDYGKAEDIGYALHVLSLIKDALGQHQEAWGLAEEALAIFRKLGNSLYQAYILNNTGYMLASHFNKYEQGEANWREALKLYREAGAKEGITGILMNLGVTEQAIHKRFDKAEASYLEALVFARELRFPRMMFEILLNLAYYYKDIQRLDEAEKAASEALFIVQEANSRSHVIRGFQIMANIRSIQGKNEAALKLLDEAQALVQPTDDPIVDGDLKLYVGHVLFDKGDYAAAEKAFVIAIHKLAPRANISYVMYAVVALTLVLAFHRHENERALALVSCLVAHPFYVLPTADYAPEQRLLKYLQETLPADVYAAAWERGKSLDFDTVVQELLADFPAE